MPARFFHDPGVAYFEMSRVDSVETEEGHDRRKGARVSPRACLKGLAQTQTAVKVGAELAAPVIEVAADDERAPRRNGALYVVAELLGLRLALPATQTEVRADHRELERGRNLEVGVQHGPGLRAWVDNRLVRPAEKRIATQHAVTLDPLGKLDGRSRDAMRPFLAKMVQHREEGEVLRQPKLLQENHIALFPNNRLDEPLFDGSLAKGAETPVNIVA